MLIGHIISGRSKNIKWVLNNKLNRSFEYRCPAEALLHLELPPSAREALLCSLEGSGFANKHRLVRQEVGCRYILDQAMEPDRGNEAQRSYARSRR